eukprot:COSAG04_NODE_3332_length_2922_cov_1.685198_3_plen_282_part_00
MCARAHPPVDCRPRRRITQRGVLPADDNPVRKLYNKAWVDFASHLPMCWMQTVCAKDAATNVRPPALRALVCVALGLGAPRACGTALSAARPVPTAEAGGAWILHGWRVCSVCRGGEAGCEGERERPPGVLDSYGLTPKSPQTNFEMMDEEVRSSSAAALPWQAPRFSPMLTCAPPAQFTKCVVYLDPEEFKTTWCGMPPPAAHCCCGAPHQTGSNVVPNRLGNKAVYRTRMAMATGGELIVLAPGTWHSRSSFVRCPPLTPRTAVRKLWRGLVRIWASTP